MNSGVAKQGWLTPHIDKLNFKNIAN